MPRFGQQTSKAAVASATAAGVLLAALTLADVTLAAHAQQLQAEGKTSITIEKVAVPAEPKQAVLIEANPAAAFLPPGAVNGLGVNVDRAADSLALRLGSILRVELRYLTLSARPSAEQRREIALEAGRAVKELARAQVGGNFPNAAMAPVRLNVPVAPQAPLRVRADAAAPADVAKAAAPADAVKAAAPADAVKPAAPAVQVVVGNRAVAVRSDPRKIIHEAVENAARAKLTPEQFSQYQDELDRKTRERREVVLFNVVAKLDLLLTLDGDQREKLQEALRTHWDDRNFPTIETMAMYEQYYPTIQDILVLPILGEGQQRIWRNAQKINFASIASRSNGQFGANTGLDAADLDRDADLKAALAPEVTP